MAAILKVGQVVRPLAANSRSLSLSVFRQIATKEVDVLPGYIKLKEKQKLFQIDNGLRIHERGGASNKILHTLTVLLCLVATAEFTRVVWTLAYPNWETFLTKK